MSLLMINIRLFSITAMFKKCESLTLARIFKLAYQQSQFARFMYGIQKKGNATRYKMFDWFTGRSVWSCTQHRRILRYVSYRRFVRWTFGYLHKKTAYGSPFMLCFEEWALHVCFCYTEGLKHFARRSQCYELCKPPIMWNNDYLEKNEYTRVNVCKCEIKSSCRVNLTSYALAIANLCEVVENAQCIGR